MIFDLDGTLVDHLGAQAAALEMGVARLGLVPIANDRPDLLSLWRQLERRHMDEYLAGACSFDEQRRRRLTTFLPRLGHEVLSEGADADWWRGYRADYAAAWAAYDDVAPCFEALA